MGERSLEQVVGLNLKRLRKDRRAWRQDDLARWMRAVGFSWTQATVAAIETGRRSLSLAELLFLPGILNVRRDRLLTELLASDDVVRVERIKLTAEAWRALNRGVFVARDEGALYQAIEYERGRRSQALMAKAKRFGVAGDDIWRAVAAELNDAEKRMARRLARDPSDVGLASVALWGHSLTDERDGRLKVEEFTGSESVRRGHITRQLAVEIDRKITEANRRRKR